MSRTLVTGIDGFTGRYLGPLLSEAGQEVHGLVQRETVVDLPGVDSLHVADLSDSARLSTIVASVQPERVVHLAGMTFVANDDADAMYAVNLVGTRNLLVALSKTALPPKSILLASSANVYGNSTAGSLSESTQALPANDYAVSKLAMEHMARLFSRQLPIVICRPFNYTGVGQAKDFLLPKIVAHATSGRSRIQLGNLDVARDFSDVRDVVRIYHRLLDCDAAIGRTVNVCSGKAHRLTDVLAIVERLAGVKFEVEVARHLVRENEVKVLLGNRSLLDSLVAPQAGHDLVDTLRWMIESELAHAN